jgi:hypothetical protein
MPRQLTPYLFLLRQPSPAAQHEAARQLKELGATVVAQFKSVAIEALVTGDQATAASAFGIFSARLKGPMKSEHLEKLTAEQRAIVDLWNARFAAGYRKLKADLTHVGKPWSAPGLKEPMPFTAIERKSSAESSTATKNGRDAECFRRRTARASLGARCRRRRSRHTKSNWPPPTRIPGSPTTSPGSPTGSPSAIGIGRHS